MLKYDPILSDTETGKILKSRFTSSFRTGYVRCKGVCMPEYYVNFAEDIINMDVRDDDVWVCSFPKTGTTWTQEMVWCIANDLDYEAAKEILPARFPFLEVSALFDYRSSTHMDMPKNEESSIQRIQGIQGRRFIKAHLPLKLLPTMLQNGSTKAKVVYVTRNPKDTCVSYFHHCQLIEGYTGDFEDFFKLFLDDAVCFAPYWDHVLEFWEASKKNSDILFITYEDMKKDLASIILKVASHLNKTLSSDELTSLQSHLSFESMKVNPATNYEFVKEFNKENKLIEDQFLNGKFMRSGQVGGWKSRLTPEMSERFDEWNRSKTKESDFSF